MTFTLLVSTPKILALVFIGVMLIFLGGIFYLLWLSFKDHKAYHSATLPDLNPHKEIVIEEETESAFALDFLDQEEIVGDSFATLDDDEEDYSGFDFGAAEKEVETLNPLLVGAPTSKKEKKERKPKKEKVSRRDKKAKETEEENSFVQAQLKDSEKNAIQDKPLFDIGAVSASAAIPTLEEMEFVDDEKDFGPLDDDLTASESLDADTPTAVSNDAVGAVQAPVGLELPPMTPRITVPDEEDDDFAPIVNLQESAFGEAKMENFELRESTPTASASQNGKIVIPTESTPESGKRRGEVVTKEDSTTYVGKRRR